MTEKLLVPDIGDFENVEVIEVLVKEGQEISLLLLRVINQALKYRQRSQVL
jgi:hypothetical protein